MTSQKDLEFRRVLGWNESQSIDLIVLFFQNARVLFNIRVVGGAAFYSYLSPQDARPLYHPAVER